MTPKWRIRDAFLRHLCSEVPVHASPGIRGSRGSHSARIAAGLGFDWFAVHRRRLGQRRGDGSNLAAGRDSGGFARIRAGFGFDWHLVRLGKETRLGCHGGAPPPPPPPPWALL